MWRKSIWVGLAACCLSALTACQTAAIRSRFDSVSAERALRKGTGRIDGQAFLRRDYGRLVTAAGERVFLIPATSYAVERFNSMFGGDMRSYFGNDVEEPPADYYRHRRETKVDMSGKFVFEDLSAGRYIVATRIFWNEPKSYVARGGAIYDIVEVKADETTSAVISGK